MQIKLNLIHFMQYILAYPGFSAIEDKPVVVPANATPASVTFTREQSESAIMEALNDVRFTWRSISALAKAAHLSETDTREILQDMASNGTVRESSGDTEVWTSKAV